MNYGQYNCSDCGYPAYGAVRDFSVDELMRYYCKRHYWPIARKLGEGAFEYKAPAVELGNANPAGGSIVAKPSKQLGLFEKSS